MQYRTQETFGTKWERFPVFEDNRTLMATGETRIKRNGWLVEEFEEWINGKMVLDAGTGMGWYTNFLTKLNPDGVVVGADIAPKAIRKGAELGNGELLVADITELPFPDETFDYIACEEVLHHTPDPPTTLQHLVSKLKSKGTYTMYIYKAKPLLREMADTKIRERTTEMSVDECLVFAEQMAELGKALYEIDQMITVPDIPLLDIEAGEYSVHEFIYRHFVKCFFDWGTENFEKSISANFDWYHPEYAYRYSEQEVRKMAEEAGLEINHFQELMSGYSLRAKKV